MASVLRSNTDLDVQLITTMTDQLRLDKSFFVDDNNQPSHAVIIALLPPSIAILKSSTESSEDLEPIIELIEAVLSPLSFEEVLTFISIDDLVSGLDSGISPLQIICIKQIAKAQPPDLVANTPLVDKLLEIFADPKTRSTQAVHDALIKLASKGQLILKRMFSASSSSVLHQMHDSDNAVLQARLMALLESILVLNWDVPVSLIQFPVLIFSPESPSWDVLQTITVIQFYRTIIEHVHPRDLVKDVRDQIFAIAALFAKRNSFSDVRSFLLTEIFLLFREISRQEYELFKELDEQYQIVSSVLMGTDSDDRISLLSYINPRYLLESSPVHAIDYVQFKASEIPILLNLFSYEPTFNRIDPDQSRLLSLAYPNLLQLLIGLAQTPFGLKKLLSEWPQVMHAVISRNNIRVPEIFNLRRELLEILIDKPEPTLGVWYSGLKTAYQEIIFGPGYGQEAQAIVADGSM